MAHQRVFPPFDEDGKVSNGPVYTRHDGKLTKNFYGYDLADLVCQQCVLMHCSKCSTKPHEFVGWSGCACN